MAKRVQLAAVWAGPVFFVLYLVGFAGFARFVPPPAPWWSAAKVAAVITEPAVFNTGCILPEPGYLGRLREQTRRHGALLIFDEVITGFRFARGGAQEYFGVTPDLTTMARGLGGGFPVASIGGSREAMSLIA